MSTPVKRKRGHTSSVATPFKDKDNEGTPEKDVLKKYRYDNQVLLKRLSEYKKAEKGAIQIVKDYDDMKVKYF